MMFSPNDYGARQKLLPASQFEGYQPPGPTLPRHAGGRTDDNQKREWVQAIREGKPELALSNFAYAAVLTEAMLLGNVAVRVGQAIEYDPMAGRVTNCPEAAPYLRRAYRKGWEL
jgi:hypothetical protein